MDEHAPRKGKKVLIAEDEPDIAKFLVKIVSEKTPFVFTAADGIEALALARKEMPDLVLIDMMMPRMNGLEVIQALQENPETAATPIVILTNTQIDSRTQRLCEAVPTVKAYISKSIGFKRLCEQLAPFLTP